MILLIPFIIVLVAVFLLTSSTTNKKICKISKEVASLNYNLSKKINSDDFDTSIAISGLSDNIANLILLKGSLNDIETSNQADSDFKLYLNESIDSTVQLYDHCILYLNNTDNINSDTLSNFISLKVTCDENYVKVATYDDDFAFTENDNIFFSKIYNAFNDSLKLDRNNKISSEQKTSFILLLNKFNSDLEFLTQDLTPAINNVRSEGNSFDRILDDIKNKEDILLKLNRDILNLSIPQGCDIYYTALGDFLKVYESYLTVLKDAVVYENTKSSSLKFQSEKEKKYKNSTEKYTDMKDYFKKYKDTISN